MNTRTFLRALAALVAGLGIAGSAAAHGPVIVKPTLHPGVVVIQGSGGIGDVRYLALPHRSLKLHRHWHRYKRDHRHRSHDPRRGARYRHQLDIPSEARLNHRPGPDKQPRYGSRRHDRRGHGLSIRIR